MGNPMWSYLEALQNLSYTITANSDRELAIKLYREKSHEKLEEYLKEKRKEIEDRKWFYYAGMVSQETSSRIEDEDDIDAFNVAFGGLTMFEEFIGIKEEEND